VIARADPPEHDDPPVPQGATIVELPGVPVVAVQLLQALRDVVVVPLPHGARYEPPESFQRPVGSAWYPLLRSEQTLGP
jgi:hypothetical protein